MGMILITSFVRYNWVWQNLAVKLKALPDIFQNFFLSTVVSIDLFDLFEVVKLWVP